MNIQTPPPAKRTAKDYASDQEVRWCPGCGDYAIIKGVQRTLAELEADPATTMFISGIGCAARFPYYLSTYGFHTIHGRAAALATGVKLTNPDLDIWVVSGDGDSLSIGGNHLLHVLRRNVDLQYLLFNNEIYGLTKGQYSPTSRVGTRSPSTPKGSLDTPVSAALFALGASARFVARGADVLQQPLVDVLKRAHAHRGASFVEILQNCIVYNDGVFGHLTDRATKDDALIHVAHGAPLVFGKDGGKGLRLAESGLKLEVVQLGDGIAESDLLVHDETDRTLATMLAGMDAPHFPVAMGVIYCDPTESYERTVHAELDAAAAAAKTTSIDDLLRRGHTWEIDE